MNNGDASWEDRLAALWGAIDDYKPQAFVGQIDLLAAELPSGSAIGSFERASAQDSTGHPDLAIPLYRAALASGLPGLRRRRAAIQLASSLRNLGEAVEAADLLSVELHAPSDELDGAVRAFLALALVDLGREREAVAISLAALSKYLPRYNRSLASYARAITAVSAREEVQRAPRPGVRADKGLHLDDPENILSASLIYSVADGIATIAIDDGKANVMSVSMLRAIDAALDRAAADKAVVVIQGRAGMFSGGFDLAVFKRDPQELFDMLEAGAELTARLLAFPYPVVAVCTGHAIAMGAFILLSTDFRIGTQHDARIQVNEVQIGLTLPRFAIEVCRQRLSPAHFNLAAVLATPYNQQQAVAAGFLDEVATPDTLAEVLKNRTDHLRKLPMESFTATKLRLRAPALALLRAAIDEDVAEWSKRFRSNA